MKKYRRKDRHLFFATGGLIGEGKSGFSTLFKRDRALDQVTPVSKRVRVLPKWVKA
jgi:hypothetical protein